MWLCDSSIGRKVVMSVTGIALVLFLTFHASMNVVALFSAEGYNMICEFLGSNWYAVAATLALAALVIIHIIYAFWLTMQNRKARGNNRYDVTSKPDKVEWASQNMLVLGIIVVLGMVLHLYNFWYNIQTLGWNGKVWFNRWKCIGNIYTTIVILMFLVVALYFSFCGGCSGSVCY